ncbi:MAG: biotin/lipoyl-binding protein [Anaerolineales bacterium]|jgi:biotin carboxyl carrier protein|nr:biotin/lipoyl-binding protein [Anaerolineales bacterium]
MKYITTIDEREYVVEIIDDHTVRVNGKDFEIDFHPIGDQPVYSLLVDGRSHEAYVYPEEDAWQVLLHGNQYSIKVEDERERRLKATLGSGSSGSSEFHLKAPMPGLVIGIAVNEGQSVKKGDLLIILESMKMQNELKSPRDGVVSRLRVKTGESVEQRQTLLSVV